MSIFTFQGLGVRVVFIAACCAALPAIGVEPDLSSPQAALKSLNRAVATQDGNAVLKVFYTANDEERGLAQAFADLILAARKLSDAEKSNYGVAGDVPANGVMSVDELSHLDRAEIKISGDTATLLPVGRLRVIQFHLTQELLGDMLGVRRVGVTKAAGALRQRRLISYNRGEISILDGEGLEAAACQCYQIVKDMHDVARA